MKLFIFLLFFFLLYPIYVIESYILSNLHDYYLIQRKVNQRVNVNLNLNARPLPPRPPMDPTLPPARTGVGGPGRPITVPASFQSNPPPSQ